MPLRVPVARRNVLYAAASSEKNAGRSDRPAQRTPTWPLLADLGAEMHLILRACRQVARSGALVRRGHPVRAIHERAVIAVGIGNAGALVARRARRLADQELAAIVRAWKRPLPVIMLVTLPDSMPTRVAASLDG